MIARILTFHATIGTASMYPFSPAIMTDLEYSTRTWPCTITATATTSASITEPPLRSTTATAAS
eukprot:3165260-Prorocentrum_lima.AAC.1